MDEVNETMLKDIKELAAFLKEFCDIFTIVGTDNSFQASTLQNKIIITYHIDEAETKRISIYIKDKNNKNEVTKASAKIVKDDEKKYPDFMGFVKSWLLHLN